jgi:hypothetical protein
MQAPKPCTMFFKYGTLFFISEENHVKIKNPLSSLITIIKPLGGLFLFQTNGAKTKMAPYVGLLS